MKFVSGLEFAKLCDLVVICSWVMPEEMKTDVKRVMFMDDGYGTRNDSGTDEEKAKVRNSKIIFFQKNCLFHFLNLFGNYLRNDVTIITHNSDYPISEELDRMVLSNPNIKKWYGQNAVLRHPKLICIPIGIGNSNNLNPFLERTIKMNNCKDNLIYINFNVETNKNRERIMDIFINKRFEIQREKSYEEYLKELSTYKFCICPAGNGIDTHRVWECLYLNVIPIVKKSPVFQKMLDLPILMIDDWEVVSRDFLEFKYNIYSSKKFNREKLNIEYWAHQILLNC